jgi:hypothetical protein
LRQRIRQGVPGNHVREDTHTFDSFECAIHVLAPVCEYCGVKVIGHGVEADGHFYCCVHCASMARVPGVADRDRKGRHITQMSYI